MNVLPESTTSFTKEQDRELILRFFAMHSSLNKFKPPLSRFLDNEMQEHRHMNEKRAQWYTKLFSRTFRLVSCYHSTYKACWSCVTTMLSVTESWVTFGKLFMYVSAFLGHVMSVVHPSPLLQTNLCIRAKKCGGSHPRKTSTKLRLYCRP